MKTPNRVEITAESLAPMMAQGVSLRSAFGYHLEFARVRLASCSGIIRLRIVEEEPMFTGEVDDDLECDCRFTGDQADASDCRLHQITARVQYAHIPEWEGPCPF